MKQKHIQHLYWRASFGADIKKISNLKLISKSKVISKLFSESDSIKPLKLDLSDFDEVKFKSKKELKYFYGRRNSKT